MNFLTIGDSAYFSSIALSAMQAKKYHPEASFIVYDWGFSHSELQFFYDLGVRVETWLGKFIADPLEDSYYDAVSRRARATDGKTGLARWCVSIAKEIVTSKNRKREWLYAQKPYCMLDWAKKSNEPFVFLDGDAFIVNKIDEAFRGKEDLAVTVRRSKEINFKYGYCRVLNSGVIFFKASNDTNKKIISHWIDFMKKSSAECYSDQTSLTRMVFQDGTMVQAGETIHLPFCENREPLKVKVFSCDEYNYNWIEEGVDPSRNKIVHFKGGRHSEGRFESLLKPLGLSDEWESVINKKLKR